MSLPRLCSVSNPPHFWDRLIDKRVLIIVQKAEHGKRTSVQCGRSFRFASVTTWVTCPCADYFVDLIANVDIKIEELRWYNGLTILGQVAVKENEGRVSTWYLQQLVQVLDGRRRYSDSPFHYRQPRISELKRCWPFESVKRWRRRVDWKILGLVAASGGCIPDRRKTEVMSTILLWGQMVS